MNCILVLTLVTPLVYILSLCILTICLLTSCVNPLSHTKPYFRIFLARARSHMTNKLISNLVQKLKGRIFFLINKSYFNSINYSPKLNFLVVLVSCFFCCSQTIFAAPQITIVWGTVTSSNSPDLLKDANGNRLSAGVRGNGDGDLVELGYFSAGSTSDPFSGQWTPLTQQTYVGDSSSGYGFNDGMFVFTTNFYKNSNEVIVYPTEPKQFSENLNFAITASNPPAGTPICIRFYDSPNKGGARYNTVTGENWLWPSFPDGSSIPSNLYFKIASGDTPNGSTWRYGNLFEDNAAENRFKTTKSPLYEINLEINPDGKGTGTISDEINGSYTWGQTISITATPQEHSYFVQWVGNGISDPWSAETSLVVTGDQVVYAEFDKEPYFLDLSANGLGQVTGDGLFAHGDFLTIFAYPDQGQSFSHWEWENNGSVFSENSTVSFSLQADTALVANFIPNEYQVLVGSTYGGSYEIFDSNGSIPSSYKHGNTYTIRSFPDQHFGFLNWSGASNVLAMLDNENFAETTFIPSGNMSLTANFTELEYQLDVQSTQGYISLYPPSGRYPATSIIEVGVVPKEGFEFDYWQDPMGILSNPNSAITDANISKMDDTGTSITAFLRLLDYEAEDINITSAFGGNIFLGTNDSGGFEHFKSYSLIATPLMGYEFDRWAGDANATQLAYGPAVAENELLIEGPVQLKALFKLVNYQMNLSSIGDGLPKGPETFTIDQNPEIVAEAFPGWRFTHWSGDIDYLVDPLSSETLIQWLTGNPPQNLSFTANFEPQRYDINLKTYGNGQIDYFIEGGESAVVTSERTISLNSTDQLYLDGTFPLDGWQFNRWDGLPTLLSLINPQSFVDPNSSVVWFYPSADLDIAAYFEIIEYDDSQVEINSTIGGNVISESESDGTFAHFSTYELNASASRGYQFDEWRVDIDNQNYILNGLNNPINEVKIEGPIAITAVFSLTPYQLNILASIGGQTTGPSSFTIQESPLITAIANEGWDFSHWTGDISYLSDPNSSSAYIQNSAALELKDLSFTAQFIRETYQFHVSSTGEGAFDLFEDNLPIVEQSTQHSGTYNSASRLTVKATPTSGWKFSQWNGLPSPSELLDAESSLNPLIDEIEFVPAFDLNISAQFLRNSYSLNVTSSSGGTSVGSGSFKFEDTVNISAQADMHYQFDRWTGATGHLVIDPTNPNNQIQIPDSNTTLSAEFIPQIYQVNRFADNNGSLVVTSTFDGITHSGSTDHNATSAVSVTAVPNDAGTHMLSYLYWENSLNESGYSYSAEFNIPFLDANYSVWAFFTDRREVGYSLFAKPPYAGSVGENTDYSSEQIQRISASSYPGYSFLGWESADGETFSPHWSLPTVDSQLSENSEISGHFAKNVHSMHLEFNTTQGEVSNFSELIDSGDFLNISAEPKQNYEFVNWELLKEATFNVSHSGSSLYPSENRIFINNREAPTLTLVRGFTYHFECDLQNNETFYLSSTRNDAENSVFESGITDNQSSSGKFTFLVPADAPSLLYYHDSGSNYSGNEIKIISLEDSEILTSPSAEDLNLRITFDFGLRANFEHTRHSLSANSIGQGNVEFTNQDIYFWGDEIAISAAPSNHWYFSHWQGSQNILDSSAPTTVLRILENTEISAVFKPVQYTVDANSSPSDYGIVGFSGDTFSYGDELSITATPAIGKQFDGWINLQNLSTENQDGLISPNATFKVLGNAKLTASFSRIVLDVDTQALVLDQNNLPIQGDSGGIIEKPAVIYHGDHVNLEFINPTGYTFLYWVDLNTGTVVTTQKGFSVSITENRQFQAVLRKKHYEFALNPDGNGSVSYSGQTPYYWEDTIDLQAVADEHWYFVEWTGVASENIADKENPNTTLTIRGDSIISARFEQNDYSINLSASPVAHGTTNIITSQESYHFGDLITVQANPRAGKVFHSWTIEANATKTSQSSYSDNPFSFNLTGNAKLTANYEPMEWNVTHSVIVVDEYQEPVDGAFGGRILGGKKFYDEDIAEFGISLSNGYKLFRWKNEDNGEVLSSENVYSHEMLANLNLTALVKRREYQAELVTSPSVGGNAMWGDNFISEKFTKEDLSYGDEIEISATAVDGYRFVKWEATGVILSSPSQPVQSITIGNDVKLTAYFAPEGLVNLSLSSDPVGASSYLYGGGSFEYDPNHAILAMAKDGYLFSHWSFNGSIAEGIVRDPDSATTSVSLDSDKSLTAVFILDPNATTTDDNSNNLYLLNVYSDNTSHGTASGSGFFRGWRTIRAFPKEGFEFSHWEGGDFEGVYDATTKVNISQDTSVIAHFQSVGIFEDSESLSNGWWGNPWFGYFWKVGEEDWLFHEDLGWIFMKKKGDQSIWVWIQKMEGWFWTAKDHYPALHSSSSQTWYWVSLEQSDFTRLVIFDYSNATWMSR